MTYANPFNVCDHCGHRVNGGSLAVRGPFRNQPCGCAADFHSVCPSWSPADGCRCVEQLGQREHGAPVFPPNSFGRMT